MRHRVYGKHLGRDKNQRTALFKGLVQSLILHESIETTSTKAKAIKGLVDKLINQAKTPATRRLIQQFIISKPIADKLINEIIPALSSRNSGYTSVIKLNRRLGDGGLQVQMSLILDKKTKSTDEKGSSTDKKIKPKVAKVTASKKEIK